LGPRYHQCFKRSFQGNIFIHNKFTIKIAWNASVPDIELSPQGNPLPIQLKKKVLLDCGQEKNVGGCDGGDKDLAHQFMQQYGKKSHISPLIRRNYRSHLFSLYGN
jgi:hypothetical protein